jgi:hypothetical protein
MSSNKRRSRSGEAKRSEVGGRHSAGERAASTAPAASAASTSMAAPGRITAIGEGVAEVGLLTKPGVVVGAVSLAAMLLLVVGVSLFSALAPLYLLRLPENYDARVAAAIGAGDAVGAIGAIDGELRRHPYNFASVFGFARSAVAAPEPLREPLARAALDRLGRAFAAHEAVRYREVFTQGWSEGEALRAMATLFRQVGRPGMAAAAWKAARAADPAWTIGAPEDLSDGGNDPLIIAASPASDGSGHERTMLLFGPDDFGAAFAESLRAQPLADGSGIVFYGRGAIDLPQAIESEVAAPTLELVARGTSAFGGWPYLLIEAVAPVAPDSSDAPATRLLGFVHLDSPDWRHRSIALLGPLRRGDRLRLSYLNDAYDAERPEDRNVWLTHVALVADRR